MTAKQLPAQFVEMLSQWPALAPLASDLLTAPEVSVRINASKKAPDMRLGAPVPWCNEGYYLDERPQFTFDPAMHQGRYYVQDASSMAIVCAVREALELLGNQPGLKYLDACAAPGGKTTAALSVLPSDALVVTNEYDYRRAEVLAENVAKWGSPNVIITRGDTARLKGLPQFFDIVAIDAPCSGEGMMRKEEKAVEQWSMGFVKQCAALQREIIDKVWPSLKPGGVLIYSTCTFNHIENEENIDYLVKEYNAQPLPIAGLENHKEIAKGIETNHPCYRFLPGRVKGEGLFICLMKKPGEKKEAETKPKKGGKASGNALMPVNAEIKRWLAQDTDWMCMAKDELQMAIPQPLAAAAQEVAAKMDVISLGVQVATAKGKDMVPYQGLVLSTALNTNAFNTVDVEKADAIAYLQRQPISVDAPKGYVLLTYQGVPLGFEKNLGNRANNLYPKNWRILSQRH